MLHHLSRPFRQTSSALLAASIGLALTACSSIPGMSDKTPPEENPDLQAPITLTDPEFGDQIPFVVQVTEKRLIEEVGLLRAGRWADAEAAFRDEIEGNRNREFLAEAYFGMGIAQEKQGNYAGALESYQNAFSRVNNVDYNPAIRRAKIALGMSVE